MKLFHKITLPAGITPSQFQRPAKVIVSGPSMSGKTTIVQYILANNLISPAPLSTHWVCEGTVPEKLPNINYIEGGIPEPEFFENLQDAAVVLDDCQTSAGDSEVIAKLFRRLSHHNRLIVFLVVQNLNFTGRRALDARRNCDYYILFRNAADHDQYQRFQLKLGLTKGLTSLNDMLTHIGRKNPQYGVILGMDNDKRFLQCVAAIRRCFRELAALSLLPPPTARQMSLYLSARAFYALTLIMRNAVPVLRDRMHVLNESMLTELRADRPLLTALVYDHEDSDDDDDKEVEDIEQRRILLYRHFKRLYPFLKLALDRLLPYAYAKQKPVATPHQLANLCNSRGWLLAVVFLPKREALTQITYHMYHPEFKIFRELADNILSGWCQFSVSLQTKLVDANKTALGKLANKQQKLSPTQIIELLDDAYPAIKVACDIITRHGYCTIFSGRKEWKGDYASFT